jgi:hypothetical protein
MTEVSRVQLVDGSAFAPREWLRREILWASLMSPYTLQLNEWLSASASTGIKMRQYSGNVSRREIYSRSKEPEYQSLAFFNQGKVIGGLVSSAALFKACMPRSSEGAYVDMLRLQADTVDRVLADSPTGSPVLSISETEIFTTCARLAKQAHAARKERVTASLWLHASQNIRKLAAEQARKWVAVALQDEQAILPQLVIPNGGTPRSAGPRVEMLQPLFHHIVESEAYQVLGER